MITPRLRVAILGNSTPLLVIPKRTRRSEGTYAELLEGALASDGVEAVVTNQARLFELIHEGARRFGTDIAPIQPDVLILHYGMLELQPNVLPTTVARDLSRREPGGRGLRRLWYSRVVPRIWPAARAWQRWASSKVGLRTWRLEPRRFVSELDVLVRPARFNHALVLIVDVHAPGPRLEHFLPGVTARWQVLQGALHAYVAEQDDPDVRLVESSSIAASLPDGGTVDGLHLTAEGHALLAERIAKEIVDHTATLHPAEDT